MSGYGIRLLHRLQNAAAIWFQFIRYCRITNFKRTTIKRNLKKNVVICRHISHYSRPLDNRQCQKPLQDGKHWILLHKSLVRKDVLHPKSGSMCKDGGYAIQCRDCRFDSYS
ncbi:hypothetical protein TNCT_19841 [Trichonephila clavata]|uniref:Uncharacterized protein n=1 Tax=Trichonephila clavata TaxID=2740835 RepID=A0A8X6FLL9_TRICU|nr:hypothetical protein TNCT_19841 [Trichonephila clavata]